MSRVGWTQVKCALRTKTAQGVVVARVDRLSQDLIAQERMIEAVHARSAGIFSIRDSETENLVHDPKDPTRKLIRQVTGAIASCDREMTRARLKAARLAKAAAGGYAHGAPPFGWTGSNGALVQVPSEQRALDRMVELRQVGLSMREIAVARDAEGHPTKRGGQWSSPTVSRILSRTAVAQRVAS